MLALMAFSWMPYARLINTNVLRLKQMDFVEAARALGAGHTRILLQHLLPNAIAPAIVIAARDVGGMVVLAAAFGFIGMGSSTLWAKMLLQSREWVIGISGNPLTYWWTFVPATVALVLFGLGWNMLGDGLNRLLDPHALRGRAARLSWRRTPVPAPAAADAHQSA
jgi:peptide/nickel transport system permease protein